MRPSRVRPVLVVASALTLFGSAFPAILADLGPGPLFYYRLLVFPADIALGATLGAAVALGIATRTRPGAGAALLALLAASLAIAFAFHPSAQGVFTVARLTGAAGLAFALSILTPTERLLAVGAIAAAAIAQLGIAIAQLVRGGPIGLAALGELADPLLDYGPLAPRGTMHAQYVLAGLALVAALLLVREAFERARPLAWCALAGLVIVPVGLTFSRAAALGLLLAGAALALALRTRPRVAAMAMCCLALGAGGAAFVDRAGWQQRSEDVAFSANGRDIENAQAIELIARSPLTGVGPGRSVFALKERYPTPPDIVGWQPAHDLPLLAAVEGGVLAGGIAVALLAVLGWRARRDVRALALFGAFLPVVLTDHYPYTYLQGLVLLGVWVGTLDALSAGRALAGSAEPLRPAAR